MNFSSAYENKKVTEMDSIFIKHDVISLGEYMKKVTTEYKEEIPNWLLKYYSEQTPQNLALLYKRLQAHSMYYLGKAIFLDKHCSNSTDVSSLTDTTIFHDILGDEIYEIYSLLISKSINENILKDIKRTEERMKEKFCQKYQRKQSI